ncbi:MAG: hypothetical protein ONA69_06000, partial [candidate division KSB1 bacterium]|nr:hypothetical protein [candidate division KSB1 bacterium]
MKYFLIAMCWIVAVSGFGTTTYYVRSGAAGKGDGSNWHDAFQQLPPQLTRGAIYYIASGSYPSYRFERCAGSEYLIIQKATREDHGTDEGWDPAYAEGPAVFSGWEILTSFIIIDGRTGGGPGNWNTGFGFQVVKTPPDHCGENGDLLRIGADLNDAQSRIEIRHTEFFAAHKYYPLGGISFYGGVSDAVISHCSIHDLFGCPFFFNSCSAIVLEYNYIAHTRSTGSFDDFCPDWHTEGISSIGVNRDITIRYNLWDDISGTAVIAGVNVGLSEKWKIYCNIFSRSVTPIRYYYDGAANLQVMNGLAFYNNNVVGIPETIGGYGVSQGGIVIDRGEGNRVFNNIWYNNIANSFVIDAEHGYNYFGKNRRVEGCEPTPCDMDEEAAADDLYAQIG